jgi:hypothetical protein
VQVFNAGEEAPSTRTVVAPENFMRVDSRDEAESARHPSDAYDPPAAWDDYRQPVQVAAQT